MRIFPRQKKLDQSFKVFVMQQNAFLQWFKLVHLYSAAIVSFFQLLSPSLLVPLLGYLMP